MYIIKIGGGKDINLDYVLSDFKKLEGKKILVHGANYEMDRLSEKLGVEPKEIISPSGMTARYTDEKVIDIFTCVYPGLVNSRVTARLQKLGVNAVGLSGIDGGVWKGERKRKILSKEGDKVRVITDNYSGRVSEVDTRLLNVLLDNGFVPVISSPAISSEGDIINADNDPATALMAHAMGVKEIVMLFEAPGFLMDHKDPSSKVDFIKYEEIDSLMESAKSTMKKKLLAVKYALNLGVEKVYFGDSRTEDPITRAFNGEGTVVSQ
jgi:acetylglutamate/LysW-gamma-L-alpha-aminoadipate kinase